MIRVNDIHKSFGAVRAVRGVSFDAPDGKITGLLGPNSNAHGPNEFLHIPMGKGLTACVSQVLTATKNRMNSNIEIRTALNIQLPRG